MKILHPKSKILNYNQKGYIISIVTFFVLIISLSVALSMSSLIFYRQKVSTNSIKSTQSYYTAESGAEDALLRLNNNPNISSLSYSLIVNGTTANVVIPNIIGGSRIIVSEGNATGIIRKIQTIYSIDSQGISFFYGAQVGAGGLTMNNGSTIKGNVFSNGNIDGGSGTIDNNVIIAGNGRSIKDVRVKGNALAYSCLSPTLVEKNLTYVTGGTRTCTVQGSISTQSNEISSQPLPISPSQIEQWKTEATNGGVITGNISLINGETQSMGPVKINGSLTLNNNSTLKLTGTIYVVGNISVDNGATIKLDSSYGSLSGMILNDGIVYLNNNSVLTGSGQPSSYLLVLSTNASTSAISINNNASGAIFYTSAGGIDVNNNVIVKELTGYKIKLNNNAAIQYESGLASVFFTNGPSGSWKVTSWGEK